MKIIIVDDHSLFRSGLVHLFSSQPDFDVVGEAGSVKETLPLVQEQQPDLIVIDLGLTDGSGVDAIPKILKEKPDVKIVILTIHASDETAFNAIRRGARGFLRKDISATSLLSALRGLERGELAVSRVVFSRYIEEILPFASLWGGSANNIEATLTFREIEVLSELSSGDSNYEIARRLSISENTVKIHVHNVLRKLKLQTRQDAAAYARRHGFTRDILRQSWKDSDAEEEPPNGLQDVVEVDH